MSNFKLIEIMPKDYYKILNISPDSSAELVRKSYRKALKTIPSGVNLNKWFDDLHEAFEVLSDEKKRAEYDRSFNDKFHDHANNSVEAPKVISLFDEAEIIKKRNNALRQKVYYTSPDLIINGLYVNYKGKNLYLKAFDAAAVRRNDESNNTALGIALIIIGFFTIKFFVGALFLVLGVAMLFYREHIVVLVGDEGDVPLMKGRKRKMRRIVEKLNMAIKYTGK